jgi:hypothetical protein
MKTLVSASAVVAGLWVVLYEVKAPIPPATAWYDKAIVWEIASVFTLASAVMLISRKIWTLRAIGIFFSSLGVGLLFGMAVYVRHVGYTVRNNRVVPNINPGTQEGLSDLARALLAVGGALFAIGLLVWLWGRFGPRRGDEVLGLERRTSVRRAEDRARDARLAELESQIGSNT